MNFRNCPHYNEIVETLKNGGSLEYFNFEIDDVINCPECFRDGFAACNLRVHLDLVKDMNPKLSHRRAELTIDEWSESFTQLIQGKKVKVSENINLEDIAGDEAPPDNN